MRKNSKQPTIAKIMAPGEGIREHNGVVYHTFQRVAYDMTEILSNGQKGRGLDANDIGSMFANYHGGLEYYRPERPRTSRYIKLEHVEAIRKFSDELVSGGIERPDQNEATRRFVNEGNTHMARLGQKMRAAFPLSAEQKKRRRIDKTKSGTIYGPQPWPEERNSSEEQPTTTELRLSALELRLSALEKESADERSYSAHIPINIKGIRQ